MATQAQIDSIEDYWKRMGGRPDHIKKPEADIHNPAPVVVEPVVHTNTPDHTELPENPIQGG